MENQREQMKISENLGNVFSYAFVETAPYSFLIPTADKYVAVNLPKKIYHCLACQKEIEVAYRQNGVVYFSKERFAKQRELYAKRGLEFPDQQAIEAETAFIYHDEGYCPACAEENSATGSEGQKIYQLCLDIHRRDDSILMDAQKIMGGIVRGWVATITDSAQLAKYDLSDYTALKDLVCAVILKRLGGLEDCLATYRRDVCSWKADVARLLKKMPNRWEAYAARPITIYESMSDELYHEYTVAFPAAGTSDQDFYVNRKIEKMRVDMFLKQPRITTVEDLIMEAGFADAWVDLFIDHVMTLKK